MLPELLNLRHWTSRAPTEVTGEHVTVHPAGASPVDGCTVGTLTSLPLAVDECTEVIMSWQGHAPDGAVIELALRAAVGEGETVHWTRWWTMGVWSEDQQFRQSVEGQRDADGVVHTDTLVLHSPARQLQWRATLQRGPRGTSPILRGCTLSLSPAVSAPSVQPHTGAIAPLAVPLLPQLNFDGGHVWCSPTSLTMVLAYWADQTGDTQLARFTTPQAVPEHTVPGVYDPVYEGTGNWPFNTAYAASLGLEAYVARLRSLDELAAWLAASVPVITSIRWRTGELDDAPVEHTDGHLIVVVGFTPAGDVIVNDPAAPLGSTPGVRRVYPREQFAHVWLGGSQGTVYLVYPAQLATP